MSDSRPRDPRVEEQLVSDHLPLVQYLVAEMASRLPGHVSRSDLMSAGLAALAEAARAFKPEIGAPFRKYATHRVRGALLDELRSHDWASRSVRARARKRDAAESELALALGRQPTAEELAGHLGVSVADVRAMENDVHKAVVLSLEAFEYDGAAEDLLPTAGSTPEDDLLDRERDSYLRDAVEVLPDRLRVVIRGLYFEDRQIREIAEELNVTESRVSQMRAEALALLKDGMNSALAPDLVSQPARPDGCVARRRAAYFTAIAEKSDFRARVSSPPPSAQTA